jgi:hypothetical protein
MIETRISKNIGKMKYFYFLTNLSKPKYRSTWVNSVPRIDLIYKFRLKKRFDLQLLRVSAYDLFVRRIDWNIIWATTARRLIKPIIKINRRKRAEKKFWEKIFFNRNFTSNISFGCRSKPWQSKEKKSIDEWNNTVSKDGSYL